MKWIALNDKFLGFFLWIVRICHQLFGSGHGTSLSPYSFLVFQAILTETEEEIVMCHWTHAKIWKLTNKLCRPLPVLDLWCWVHLVSLGFRGEFVWLWWRDANPFPRPIVKDKQCPRDRHLGEIGVAQICTLGDLLDSHLWRSSVICRDHLPMVSVCCVRVEKNKKWPQLVTQSIKKDDNFPYLHLFYRE